MREQPSLRRAAALSLAVHMMFAGVAAVSIKRPPRLSLPASPYVVSLVAEPASEKAAGAALETAPQMKAAPAKTKKNNYAEKEDRKQYKAKKLEDLREKRESKQYRSDRLGALKAKKALKERLGAKTGVENAPSSVPRSPGRVKAAGAPAGADNYIMADYFAMASGRIWEEWVFPAGTDDAAGLEAVISIKILKDGTIKIKDIEKSSGNPMFDGSALKAINRASPLKPPPFEMEIGVRFTP